MDTIRSTVARALDTVDQIAQVLEGAGSDCGARTQALRAWREEHAAEITQLTLEIRKFSMEELKPVILEERVKHPLGAKGMRLAMECANDEAFAAEWATVNELLGGSK